MSPAARPSTDLALDLFKRRFLNRTDCVAVRTERGTPRPVEAGAALEHLLRGHLEGEDAPVAKIRFHGDHVHGAMSGRFRIGSYCPAADNTTRWVCLDFDGDGHAEALRDPEAAARAAYERFQGAELPAYLERSGGGRGWHVWCFFDPPIPAAKARTLGRALCPEDAPLTGGGVADPRAARGIEVFPKQARIRKDGYGNLVWLPWWAEAPEGANVFYRPGEDGRLEPFVPVDLEVASSTAIETVLAAVAATQATVTPSAPSPAAPESPEHAATWAAWRERALAALPLDAVYGPWLTGRTAGPGWLECRDPASASGDTNPSASVADGSGEAERGSFHSFLSGQTIRVFDFLMAHGGCADFRAASARVAELSGVPLPEPQGEPARATLQRRRPRIQLNGRSLDAVVHDAWRAVRSANRVRPTMFRRGSGLVRLVRADHHARLESLSETGVFGHLATVADWVRATEDGDVLLFPSKDAARVMLDLPDADVELLDGVVSTPVFAPDGTLVEAPGYHREARLWHEPEEHLAIPPVPERPTDGDVAAARALLFNELLCDFPFVDTAARAHFVAALLLPFVRRMIAGPTPIHIFEAPAEGSGKNLLVNLVAVIVTGSAVTGGSIPRDEDEVRKKLGAELGSGRPLLVLDNADPKRRLDSSAIASATTMWPEWTDRLLGQNKTFSVPNDVLWVLTANNPRLSREIARRCISIRIDPGVDQPWLREQFRHPDLLHWTLGERGNLIHATLVLVRHWIAAGRPRGTTRLGSFERWSEVIGGILAAAGIQGFLGNLEALYSAADAEGSMWRAFVRAWWETHGARPVRIADLLEMCTTGDLMSPVLGDGSERSQSTRLGSALQGARDRVFAHWRIESAGRDAHSKAALYGLSAVASAGAGESRSAGEGVPTSGSVRPDAHPIGATDPEALPDLTDFEDFL